MLKKGTVLISIFNFVYFLSMRSIWSGIQGMFGIVWLQYLLFGLLLALAIASVILFFLPQNTKKIFVGVLIASVVFTLVLSYMFYLGIGSVHYILRSFGDILFWLILIGLSIFMIFVYPKTRCSQSRVFKFGALSFIVVAIVVVTFNLKFCFITNMPVVYAVEEEYQIVWTTSSNATGQVVVDGVVYSDLYSGSLDSETIVHKVVIPMAALNQAKSYQIRSSQIIYRGPYSGVRGRTIEKTLDFEPVDLSDGLNYYSLSDSHEYVKAASETGTYFGDELDFLIMAGDITSHLEECADIEMILEIAYNITEGSHPVIYARGNHETKGDVANILYQYVGSKNEKFYYTVKMNGVEAVVLDLGEDHNDDWWEFYDTAYFTEYRNEQTAFLESLSANVVADKDAETKVRLAICHIPVNYVTMEKTNLPYGGDNMFLSAIKAEWTELLDTLHLDLMISGHHHQLMPITTDIPANTPLTYHENYWEANSTKQIGYRTDSTFDTFIISRRSTGYDPLQKENLFGRAFTGLAVSVELLPANSKKTEIYFTNNLKDIVSIVHPFNGTTIEKTERTSDIW